MKKTNSVINLSSDDSFGIPSNQNVNLHEEISTGQRSSPEFSRSDNHNRNNQIKNKNRPNSPVFNYKRQHISDKTIQVKERDKQKSNNTMLHSRTALPGSPEFARERAEVLHKKKMKNKNSPFTHSKFNLSPLKAGVNCLSSCTPKDKFMWSPSPIKKDSHLKDDKKDSEYSGFVKSSKLLTKPTFNASKPSASTSASGLESSHGMKAKKRKIATVSSQDSDCLVRTKTQKQKANFSWPSSSDSSDEGLLSCSLSKKFKKAESKANATERINSYSAGHRSALYSDGLNLSGVKPGSAPGCSGSVNGNLHRNTEKSRVTLKDRCKTKSSTTGSRSKPINYLDIDDESAMSRPHMPPSAKHKNSGSGSLVRGGTESPYHFYGTISPIKSTSPCSKHSVNKTGNLSFSPKLRTPTKSPTISTFPMRPTTQGGHISTSHGSNNNYKIAKSNRVVAPGVTELSPIKRQRPAHRNSNISKS